MVALENETMDVEVKKEKKLKKKTTKNGVDKVKKVKKVKKDSNGEVVKKKKKKESSNGEPAKKKKKSKAASDSDPSTSEEEKPAADPNSHQVKGDFKKFPLTAKTIELLKEKGISYLFPIQYETFHPIYDGKDVIAQARTGTGKTMSFVLPVVEKLLTQPDKCRGYGRLPRVLVMCPTRELAEQVHSDFDLVKQKLKTVVVYGGTPYWKQEQAFKNGVDIIVGTPGRIQDHINKGNLDISTVEFTILDEVDQMLDMGFAPAVEEIFSNCYTSDHKPQSLLFSATCPPWVQKTSKKYMDPKNLEHIDTIGNEVNKTSVHVKHLAIRCGWQERPGCMSSCVQMYSGLHGRAIIFTETKKECNELVVFEELQRQKPQVLHGDIEQKQRTITMKAFRDGNIRCLVATNVAARGLDIPEIDLVIQSCPPKDWESYTHRSGRTGRAGRDGTCICFFKPNEERDLRELERKTGIKFQIVSPPQPKDIVETSISDTITSLEKINKKMVEQFMDHAKNIAEKYEGGAVEALAAAIALCSGASSLENRSLLTSRKNYTTWQFEVHYAIRFNGFVYGTVEKFFGLETKEKMSGLKLFENKLGAVFDLPEECTELIESTWQDSPSMKLFQATELPPLVETKSYGGGNRWGGGGWGRNGGGGRGGYGNKGGRGGWGGKTHNRNGGGGGGYKRKWGQ